MASSADYIRSLVESKPPGHHANVVEIIAAKLDGLLSSILSSEKMAREAMSELLKATFNLLLHYPRVRRFLGTTRVILLENIPARGRVCTRR